MSLAKTSDKRDRLSTGRSRNQHSFRPASMADRASGSGIETDGARANRLSFAEDFMLEHTNSGLHITLIGMAGASVSVAREPQKSTQCYGFPS
jgi:hypothetical protein